ncbi:unnamed protein product [Brassica oleracea var. botrytis]
MKPFNSNLVKANEAETSDTDHLEHILGKHWIPISLIPKPLYEKSIDFINTLPFDTLPAFVLWSSDLILTEWPEVVKVEQRNSNKSKVATFVVLAMALRTQPDALTLVLTNMKERPTYQGQDKLPVIIWMMAQVHSDGYSLFPRN